LICRPLRDHGICRNLWHAGLLQFPGRGRLGECVVKGRMVVIAIAVAIVLQGEKRCRRLQRLARCGRLRAGFARDGRTVTTVPMGRGHRRHKGRQGQGAYWRRLRRGLPSREPSWRQDRAFLSPTVFGTRVQPRGRRRAQGGRGDRRARSRAPSVLDDRERRAARRGLERGGALGGDAQLRPVLITVGACVIVVLSIVQLCFDRGGGGRRGEPHVAHFLRQRRQLGRR
jgi:hypothetical protein